MKPALELRWTFLPADYFEESFIINDVGYQISFQSGIVVATIERTFLEADPTLRTNVETYVNNMFLGIQIQSHTTFELSKPGVTNLNSDGIRGLVIECGLGQLQLRGHRVDLIYTREDGTIINTAEERIQQKRLLSRLSAKLAPSDEVLSRALRSYSAAVRDPEDELVHLYEIRDALVQRFSSDARAMAQLRISKKLWSRFGQLCNVLPLKQGRHRGSTIGLLRPATEEELNEARTFATTLIEAYLKSIESAATNIGRSFN